MSILGALDWPTEWSELPFGRLVDRSRESGMPDLQPLSVFLDEGVVPRASREDNYNRLGADISSYLLVRPGDLVFNKLRTWQGGIGASAHLGIVSPAYFVCRPKTEVFPLYLHYVLRSTVYLQELTRISKWMPPAQFDIAWEDLREVPVWLPPFDQQREIANYLDAETARINAVVLSRRRSVTLLEDRFETAVWLGVTKGLSGARLCRSGLEWADPIPEQWGKPSIGQIFEVQLGKMLNPEATSTGEQFPYLRNENVQWDRIDVADVNRMHFDAEERVRFSLQPGDLLVCEGGEVGRAAIWRGELDECYYQKALHRLRPRGPGDARYLMYVLRAAARRGVFEAEGNTSTIVHLTSEKLRAHRVPLPPMPEQSSIVRHLDREAARLAAARSCLQRQIALLRERRTALITAAITGQVEVPGVAA